MFSLKYDRYFRFHVVYDEELKAYGAGLEEYKPAQQGESPVIYSTSVYADCEEQILKEVMRRITSRAEVDETLSVRERGMYYIDLRKQYPDIVFRYLRSITATQVEQLANKALDDQHQHQYQQLTTIGDD